MAIEKNNFKVSRFDSEFSPHSRDTNPNTMLSSEDEEFQRRNLSAVESDDDDEDDDFDDCDSGAGSDDIDLLEFGEPGEEFCRVGDQTCSIPVELYDLSGLRDVLCMDVWNEVLTEEERFGLAQYLPDMDQENFLRTLMELLTGCNLHFGNPMDKLFDMLKGGLCEPRVALYRQGLNFFQRRQHYHLLWKHQNTMVSNLCQMKDAWLNCKSYSIEEKLQVLNIMKSQKSLMYEKMEELKTDSSEMEEAGDGTWGKRAKDRKLGQKFACQSGYGMGSALEFPSHGRQLSSEPAKLGKQNKKGTLKLGGSKCAMPKELACGYPSVYPGMELKSGSYGSALPLSQHYQVAGFDPGAAFHVRDQIKADDYEEESMYEVSVHRDQNFSRAGVSSKSGAFKRGKNHEPLRVEEYTDNFMGLPNDDLHLYGGNSTVNQLSDIKVLTSKARKSGIPYYLGKKVKNVGNFQHHASEDQIKYGKGRIPNLSLKGSQMETLDVNEPFWLGKQQGGPFSAEHYKYGDCNGKSKKWKMGRDSPELGVNDQLFDSEYRQKPLQGRVRGSSMQNGGQAMGKSKGIGAFAKNDEIESDSSEQIDEDEDDNPLIRSKWAYPRGISDRKFFQNSKESKLVKKDAKDGVQTPDESSCSTRQMSDFDEHQRMIKSGNHNWRTEQKGRRADIGQVNSSARDLDGNYFSGSDRLTGDDDWQQIYMLGRNGHIQEHQSERSHIPIFKAPNVERRRKGKLHQEYSVPQSKFLQDNALEEDDDSLLIKSLAGKAQVRLGKRVQVNEKYAGDRLERSDVGCNSVTKKRKVKDDVAYMDEREIKSYLASDTQLEMDDTDSSKNHGKKKLGDDTLMSDEGINEVPVTEMEVEDVESDIKPQKKSFTPITPTVHTGFSFSIIHLLSAIRMSMITPLPENSLEVTKHRDQTDGAAGVKEVQDIRQDSTNGNYPHADLDFNMLAASSQPNVPSLTVQEIVNRVRSNPGDPCILETQEPLQDLVRGVLKIFSYKTAPLGAKGWKSLVVYEKINKSWSWIGPVKHRPSDNEDVEEMISPEAWGIPHKMLVKLVDSFANWLKNGQETLQQIGSLPAPPLTLMQSNLDEKERFKDLRAQKSLTTISPSCDELRSYFRQEEFLRYSIPDRAFSYMAIDGKKSIVAPLRRCGGKPTSKARDHFMLKRDRPPHVTILCLVRDAAARLPGSIGTRADVCTLIRDSQYIVEDVSDAQVNQVVSGALDRLHYERDPCVQFDGERKLWVYLHREREEEDFEDDGTSSTKKWKRPKKEANEPLDVTVAFQGPGEQNLSSDLNIEPSCTGDDRKPEIMCYDARDNVEENVETSHRTEQCADLGSPTPLVWDSLGLNPLQESNLLCQENSTNEDFDNEIFDQEPSA
ncbi:hypothetical protein ACH5RR_020875 [Cinchona calisaya]|uniref:DEUBAD domain-containing protein n=1 Tax=Cinchona calisaya TaxID=153742 RepID=A0ABD2ZFP0_9GENT